MRLVIMPDFPHTSMTVLTFRLLKCHRDGRIAYPPSGPDPLPQPLILWPPVLPNHTPDALKRRIIHITYPLRLLVPLLSIPRSVRRRHHVLWHWHLMLHQIPGPSTTALSCKTHRSGEDRLPPLPRLHRPCRKTLSIPDSFNMVEDWNGRVAGEDKVTVHAVDGEVGRDCGLGSGEALRDGSAAEDSARSRRMPEWAGIGIYVGTDVGEWEEREDGFDGGVGRI